MTEKHLSIIRSVGLNVLNRVLEDLEFIHLSEYTGEFVVVLFIPEVLFIIVIIFLVFDTSFLVTKQNYLIVVFPNLLIFAILFVVFLQFIEFQFGLQSVSVLLFLEYI